MNNIKITNSEIIFRIDVNFENCEVDMVYKELAAAGVQTPVPSILCDVAVIPINKAKMKTTPTRDSVEFCLQWLAGFVDRSTMTIQTGKWDKDYSKESITKYTDDGMAYITYPDVKTELEELGLDVLSTHSLMMGCCHLNCSCPPEIFSMEIVEKANKIVKEIFDRFCIFYDS